MGLCHSWRHSYEHSGDAKLPVKSWKYTGGFSPRQLRLLKDWICANIYNNENYAMKVLVPEALLMALMDLDGIDVKRAAHKLVTEIPSKRMLSWFHLLKLVLLLIN